MKCYEDERDGCRNILRCSELGKCAYANELRKIKMDSTLNNCKAPIDCISRQDCLLARACQFGVQSKAIENIHHFTSGASSSDHKPPYECLTLTLLKRSALRMQKGMHYGKHNWKLGIQDKSFILDRLNHAMEHLIKAQSEIDGDITMTDDDLAAVVVNCMFAMEYQSVKKD